MTQDPNKKTLRSFQCRDYLWDIFEQMSGELECSVDYLINEAMRQYARSRNYGTRPSQPPRPGSGPPMAQPQQQGSGSIPSLNRGSMQRAPSAPPPPPGQGRQQPSPAYGGYGGGNYPAPQPGYGPPQPGGQMAPQHMPGPPQYQGPPMAPQHQGHQSSYPPGPTHRPPAGMQQSPYQPQQQPMGGMGGMPAPPPLPGAGGYGAPMGAMPRPTLFVIFNGQKIPVAKDEFVIGRGSKTADLPIKDGNISRRHAAIVYQDGAFWMKDLGSTNGVEYAGQRVDTKRIDEGDVFQLCDYELRFTYR